MTSTMKVGSIAHFTSKPGMRIQENFSNFRINKDEWNQQGNQKQFMDWLGYYSNSMSSTRSYE